MLKLVVVNKSEAIAMLVDLTLEKYTQEGQQNDEKRREIKRQIDAGKALGFRVDDH